MRQLACVSRLLVGVMICCGMLAPAATVMAQSDSPFPPAEIVHDEGGPVAISGEVTYTNLYFTAGVAAPLVILEDQAGFVDRNESFLLPPESQTLGQITSDFYTSPFSYTVALPMEPQASLRDVDNDGEEDTGVMVFAVAYWTNTFGDPFLEERDLYGGGWSTAYASTRVSSDASTKREIIGGKFLVFAEDDQQGFPNGFGEDGLLFTEDDPIVGLPAGYTVVDMDTDPFTFDRSAKPTIDLIEPEGSALSDFSQMSYSEAFDAMIEKMRKEYAFTDYKGIDWDAKVEEFRPRFVEAEENNDFNAYRTALRDFAWSIPDGHIRGPGLNQEFQTATGGGLGIAIRELDDGRTIVNFVLEDSPAAEAGIELGTEIVAINGQPIADAISDTLAWSGPFSTEHYKRLQQMRYVTRFLVGEETEVTFINSNGEEETVTMTAIPERESFSFSSFLSGLTSLNCRLNIVCWTAVTGMSRSTAFSTTIC
ncbi:MAG: PDZ domain-containing protein [Caldilineaceae bacterium]